MAPQKKKEKKRKGDLDAERKAQEEVNRKKVEEEKARAEAERLKQLEAETARKEAFHTYRIAELERLGQELRDIEEYRAEKQAQLNIEEVAELSHIDWQKYTTPTTEPDPSNQKEINAYLSLQEQQPLSDIVSVVNGIKETIRIAEGIEDKWVKQCADGIVPGIEEAQHQQQACNDLSVKRLELATIEYLRFSDFNLNDREELQAEFGTADSIWTALWASFASTRPIRKSIQFETRSFQLDLPKQVLQAECLIYRLSWYPWDMTSQNLTNHGGALVPMGGIIQFDLLRPPRAAFNLRGRGWLVREKPSSSNGLHRVPYPSNATCKWSFKLPDWFVMHDGVRMARWESTENKWLEEGINDFAYNETTRTIHLHVAAVGLFATVQSNTAGFPFISWSLEPIRVLEHDIDADSVAAVRLSNYYEMHAQLHVETYFFRLTFEIQGTNVKLATASIPQLDHLRNKPFTPAVLLNHIQRCGINIMPNELVFENMPEIVVKQTDLEIEVGRQISSMAAAFDLRSCRWNQTLSKEQIVVDIRETGAYIGGCEEGTDFDTVFFEMDCISESYHNAPDAGLLMPSGVKVTCIHGDNFGQLAECSVVPRRGEQTHVHLLKVMEHRCSSEAIDRAYRSSPKFHKALGQMFSLMRLLSMS